MPVRRDPFEVYARSNEPIRKRSTKVREKEPNGQTFEDTLCSELRRLVHLYNGLPREKDAIYSYLEDLFRVSTWIRRANRRDDTQLAINRFAGKRLDRRVARSPERLLI